jgi:hypothetical protein
LPKKVVNVAPVYIPVGTLDRLSRTSDPLSPPLKLRLYVMVAAFIGAAERQVTITASINPAFNFKFTAAS